MDAYWGHYLTAHPTYSDGSSQLRDYGIFVSNARGPGTIEHAYASNMADSGLLLGACPDCNAVSRTPHAQNTRSATPAPTPAAT